MKRLLAVTMMSTAMSIITTGQTGRAINPSGEGGPVKTSYVASARQEGRDRSVKHTRITAVDIARLPVGESYIVDLTRRGTIYDLSSTSRTIDFSRVKVRTAAGVVTFETWLKRRLPRAIGSQWKSGLLRVGLAQDFGHLNVRQPRPSRPLKNYDCDEAGCVCHGHDDCIKMFDEGVCGGEAVCIETDPNRPVCSCDRP